jgi:hypothetical protein
LRRVFALKYGALNEASLLSKSKPSKPELFLQNTQNSFKAGRHSPRFGSCRKELCTRPSVT